VWWVAGLSPIMTSSAGRLISEGITEIISGGARGADTLAEMYARHRALPVKVFPAEWDKYGKSAGFRRNADIVKNSDIIVAFWDGKSKGTKHTIDLARRYFKEVKIIKFGA